jgi:hypothetical protein
MQGLDGGFDEASDTVYRDVIMLALAGFMTIVILMLAHLNPKAQAMVAKDAAPPGNVMIEANWPPDFDSDVDLWVQAPGDRPVGYSNKGGAVFNLLRDDLGHQLDLSGRNYEVSYARGLVPGEYTVNAHLYRNRSSEARIPLNAVITVKRKPGEPSRQILASEAQLSRENQEITVFRFRLDGDGQLQRDSVTSLYRPLRSGVKS